MKHWYILIGVPTGLISSYYIWKHKKKSAGPIYQMPSLKNKVYIVTGADSGIGYQVTNALAGQKARVYMLCRDVKKCHEKRKEISMNTQNRRLHCRKCDLTSQKSITHCVEKLLLDNRKIDGLINNAAIRYWPKHATEDGIEYHWAVNYLGHFLLTALLVDHLKSQQSPARIVNVNCYSHEFGKVNFENLNGDQDFDSDEAYFQSKAAQAMFTPELARRLKGSGVTCSSADPNVVVRNTGLYRIPMANKWLVTRMFTRGVGWLQRHKTPEQAANVVLYAALDPEAIERDHGPYFVTGEDGFEEKPLKEEFADGKAQVRLWLTSEKWSRLAERKAEVAEFLANPPPRDQL